MIGDLKHSNVLVSQRALVTLVDTDSFQVRDPNSGRIYPCQVGTPDYTPPERGQDLSSTVPLRPEHDLFALGVLIFQLLMEGTHPFAGVYMGEGEPPPFEERIADGHFPYGTDPGPYRPGKRTAPPFEMLPPPLQALFQRCFEAGHRDPPTRPDAKTWRTALDEACSALRLCAVNPHHFYSDHLSDCPWCARRDTQLRGLDPFPAALPAPEPNRRLSAGTQPSIVMLNASEPNQSLSAVTQPYVALSAPLPTPTDSTNIAQLPSMASLSELGKFLGFIGVLCAIVFGYLFLIGQSQSSHIEPHIAEALQTTNSGPPRPFVDAGPTAPESVVLLSPHGQYRATYRSSFGELIIEEAYVPIPVARIAIPSEQFASMAFSEDEKSLRITTAYSARWWDIAHNRYQ